MEETVPLERDEADRMTGDSVNVCVYIPRVRGRQAAALGQHH